MTLATDHTDGVAIVRVGETRLMYPLLSDFADAVTALVKDRELKILIDLSPVVYVDSASIGYLMDLYRQSVAAGGTLKPRSGVRLRQPRHAEAIGRPEAGQDHADDDRRTAVHRDPFGRAERARDL